MLFRAATCALALFCLGYGPMSVAHEWELVQRTPNNDEFHLDPPSLLRDGDMRRVWMLANYAQTIESGGRSLRFLVEYRCDAEEWRTVEVLESSAPMGTGEIRRRGEGFGEWRKVDPESVIEKVMLSVCSD